MKRLSVMVVCLCMGMMVYGQKTSKTARDKEAMAFYFKEGDAFDFGKVPQGPALLHTFEFVNDSKTPIVMLMK